MRNILLQVADDMDINNIISMLKSFGSKVTVELISDKEKNDDMDWLGKIYTVDDFKPLKREELYDR